MAQVAILPFVLAVQAEQPWQNIDDLVNYAKNHPGQIKYGHWGAGSLGQIIGKTFAKDTGITLEQVPFRGGAESLTALLGGHIQIAIMAPAELKEHMKNGTVRVLASTGEQRMVDPVFANVPTLKELGLNIVYDNWYGVAAPKGLPPEIKTKLVEGFKAIILDPEFQKNIDSLGVQLEYLGPEESQAKWIADSQKLSTAIQETGILEQIKAQKK